MNGASSPPTMDVFETTTSTTTPSNIPSDLPSLTPSSAHFVETTTEPPDDISSMLSDTPSMTQSEIPIGLLVLLPSYVSFTIFVDSYIFVAAFLCSTAGTSGPSNSPTMILSSDPTLVPGPVSTGSSTIEPPTIVSDEGGFEPTRMPTDEPSFTPTQEPTKSQKGTKQIPSDEEPSIVSVTDSPTQSGEKALNSTELPSISPLEERNNSKTRPRIHDSNETESKTPTMVSATTSVTLKNQETMLDLRKIAVFESIALQFLKDHYTRIIDEAVIRFESVRIVSVNPHQPARRTLAEDDPVNDTEAEVITFPMPIDIDVLFDVIAEILPEKEFVFVDFKWVVETLFDVNQEDFYERLEKTGEFKPVGIVGGTEATNQKPEIDSTNEGNFSTWMIGSLGAVAFSVFLTAILVTGAVRRTRQNRLVTNRSMCFRSSSSAYENDIRSHSPSMQTGLSAGLEEESLDGLRLVQSASSLKSGVSALGRRSIKDEYGSIIIPVEETNEILKKLSSNSEKELGLNARMRKRLIEREVQSRGYEAGLSMEAILRATSSFNSEDEDSETQTGLRPSPIDVDQGHSDHNRTRKPTTGGLFSNWFVQRGEKLEEDEDLQLESQTTPSGCGKGTRKEKRGLSLPSKAEVITVGESVMDEQFPISTTNWNVWESSSAIRTPTMQQLSEKKEIDNKKSPFKFLKPSFKKAALRAIGRAGQGDNDILQKSKQLSDEYDRTPGHAHTLEYNFGISNSSSNEDTSAKEARKHRLKASTPLWMGEQHDKAMGFVHIASGYSTTAGSRESSLSSFPTSPRISQRPPRHFSVGTDGTSSTTSSWKRPGKIKTEFASSSPLRRRLARAGLDPPDRLNPIHHHPRTPNSENRQNQTREQHIEGNRQDVPVVPAPSRKPTNLPHSSVRLVKKNSSLSKISKSRKSYKVVEEYTTIGIPPSKSRRGTGRIGASPMVEMSVESNDNAMILGSMETDYGGLELEWGLTI